LESCEPVADQACCAIASFLVSCCTILGAMVTTQPAWLLLVAESPTRPSATLGAAIARCAGKSTMRGCKPRAVVERRMQRGQLIGGPQARVPLYVPYADFFQYQAGAGRLAGRA
jgi:hypothetical protein